MSPPAEHSVRKPDKPFYFNTSESLIRIGRQKANNISELWQGLQTCPDDSIFQHTFRTLQEHHLIRQGFSNDFARRIGASGREHVKENFLMTTNVKRWLLLFRILEEAKARGVAR